MTIANNETLGIIERIRPRPGKRSTKEPVDLDAGTDGFFALLGSDNGRGAARMLVDYPQMFGRKTISSVRVFPGDICWFLDEVVIPKPAAPDPSSAPSRKERRRQNKSSRD